MRTAYSSELGIAVLSGLAWEIAHKGTSTIGPKCIYGLTMSQSSLMHPGLLARMGFAVGWTTINIFASDPIKHSLTTPIELIVQVTISFNIINIRPIISHSNKGIENFLKVDAPAAFFPIAIAGWIGFGCLVRDLFFRLGLRCCVGPNRRF